MQLAIWTGRIEYRYEPDLKPGESLEHSWMLKLEKQLRAFTYVCYQYI